MESFQGGMCRNRKGSVLAREKYRLGTLEENVFGTWSLAGTPEKNGEKTNVTSICFPKKFWAVPFHGGNEKKGRDTRGRRKLAVKTHESNCVTRAKRNWT